QESAEGHKQAQRIPVRQIVRGFVRFWRAVLPFQGRTQSGLEFAEGAVIKAKVGSFKSLFQDGRSREQRHGGSFGLIRRNYQDFALPFEKRSGHAALYVLGESDGSVIQADMQLIAIKGGLANLVHPSGVQTHAAQL